MDNHSNPPAKANTSNTASQTHSIPEVYYVRGIASLSLALITSLGNGLVIFLFIKDPQKKIRKSPTNILITSLAIVDFVVGFLLEPLGGYWFLASHFHKEEPFERKYLEMAAAYLLLVSVFHLLGITRDRHLAILNPLEYALKKVSRKRSYAIVSAIWVYCSVLVIGLRFVSTNLIRNAIFCLHIDVAVILSVTLFCSVLRSLRQQTLSLQRLEAIQFITARSMQRERKVTKTMGLMLGVFLICTLPWFLMMQILPICSACKKHFKTLVWIFKLFFVLFQANCAFNPFLCAWRLSQYRAAIKILFHRSIQSFSRKSSQQTTTTVSFQQRGSSFGGRPSANSDPVIMHVRLTAQ